MDSDRILMKNLSEMISEYEGLEEEIGFLEVEMERYGMEVLELRGRRKELSEEICKKLRAENG